MSWTISELDPAAEPALFDAIISLRMRCWAALMPVPLTRDDLLDPFDETARHWVAAADGELIGAARLSTHDRLDDVPEADCLGGVYASPPPAPIGFLSRLVV